MRNSVVSGFGAVLIIAAQAFIIDAAFPALAQASGPFADFEGAWSGTGSVAHQDGTMERLRCSAEYAPRGENMLSQRLRCKSDSTNFDLVNTIQNDGGRLFGEWLETSRNARGNISGRLGRGTMQGTAQGPGFAASIAVAVRNGKQTVSIRAQGGDINTVTIALARGR